jgi:hypothetical protein
MVMRRPRAKARARSPSARVNDIAREETGRLTVLGEEVLEVVEIETLVVLGLLCKWDEEANQEDGDDKDNEGNGVLESTPDALAGRLLSVLCRVLVVFLVPEVGKGDDEQAEKRIE